jgi:hypothetical protein
MESVAVGGALDEAVDWGLDNAGSDIESVGVARGASDPGVSAPTSTAVPTDATKTVAMTVATMRRLLVFSGSSVSTFGCAGLSAPALIPRGWVLAVH